MQTQNEGNGTVQFLMKIYWAGIWTKSRMIPSSIPSKQMKFSYWNKRKLKLGMTMNEMNDIRDMSHSKSERKQKRPILKLFINKFSPISLKMDKFPPPHAARMSNLLHPCFPQIVNVSLIDVHYHEGVLAYHTLLLKLHFTFILNGGLRDVLKYFSPNWSQYHTSNCGVNKSIS